MLELKGISRSYGRVQALRDLDLTVPDGTLFGLMGQNGAGKTTLLKIIAGILAPDRGELQIDGIDAMKNPAAARELREETGYEGNLIRLGGFYASAGYCSEYLNIYLARDLRWNPLPQDDDEFLANISMPVEEAFAMAENGGMEDSKTIAALMMAQKHIRKG